VKIGMVECEGNMGKDQTSISVSKRFYMEVQNLFEKYPKQWEALNIKGVPALVRLMAKFGRKPLLEFVEGKKPLGELLVEIDKPHKKRKENLGKP